MKRRDFLKMVSATAASFALGGCLESQNTSLKKTSHPNIVLIMADDMGYSDIGCYGSEIKTPNLDKLAAGGVRMTQFYNTARCCPTRASLLTGLYPHQTGVGYMTSDRGQDGYRGDLNNNCVTIAEVLKPAGYSTYMAGNKAHKGRRAEVQLAEESRLRQVLWNDPRSRELLGTVFADKRRHDDHGPYRQRVSTKGNILLYRCHQ